MADESIAVTEKNIEIIVSYQSVILSSEFNLQSRKSTLPNTRFSKFQGKIYFSICTTFTKVNTKL